MRQVTVHTTISAPREEVFDFVADLAARPAYTDHYLSDYRLARANSYGKGAAATFFVRAGLFATEPVEIQVTECERPRRIVEEARIGRRLRTPGVAVYEFFADAGSVTRVELTTYSDPKTLVDRIRQRRAYRGIRRQTKIALERLRMVFEEPTERPLRRATIAGYEPAKAARFGAHTGTDPGRAPRPGHGPVPGAHRELQPPALAERSD